MSKSFLPDVNVWLAMVSERHAHAEWASRWFEALEGETACFCRITQMGLLRLLTNERVMGGDVLTQAEAWQVYGNLFSDPRVALLAEPLGLEYRWATLTSSQRSDHRRWTDAHLQAFAQSGGLHVVTPDRGLAQYTDPSPLLLGPPA